MLYSRTFKDFESKSKNNLKKYLSILKKWFGTSKFSSHFFILIFSFFILTFFRANPYYSAQITSTGDVWGEYDSGDELKENDIILAFQVSDNSIIKPYIPYTEESSERKPEERTYQTLPGDTYESIANKFGVTEKALKAANKASSNNELVAGMYLTIPVPKGMWYAVEKGDTIGSIAKEFNVNPDEIIIQNDVVDPEGLAEGRKIVLPGVFPTNTPVPQPTKVIAKETKPKTKNKQKGSSSTTVTTTNTPPKTDAKFGWPVDPQAVFQSQAFWSRHPGVDLASKGGKNIPIYASSSGKVIYSDWSNRGYGKMIMLDHENGYYTVYGHFYKMLVKNGQKVKRGQVLGYMGTTGYSTGVHLHFEICTNKPKSNHDGCEGYNTATRLNPRRFF